MNNQQLQQIVTVRGNLYGKILFLLAENPHFPSFDTRTVGQYILLSFPRNVIALKIVKSLSDFCTLETLARGRKRWQKTVDVDSAHALLNQR